jgi:hypothetical protein
MIVWMSIVALRAVGQGILCNVPFCFDYGSLWSAMLLQNLDPTKTAAVRVSAWLRHQKVGHQKGKKKSF